MNHIEVEPFPFLTRVFYVKQSWLIICWALIDLMLDHRVPGGYTLQTAIVYLLPIIKKDAKPSIPLKKLTSSKFHGQVIWIPYYLFLWFCYFFLNQYTWPHRSSLLPVSRQGEIRELVCRWVWQRVGTSPKLLLIALLSDGLKYIDEGKSFRYSFGYLLFMKDSTV